MASQDFPSSVPVCPNRDEKEQAYEEAKGEQRPFVAVTDEEDMPGWRALYRMDPTGEGRENWYVLTNEAVTEVDDQRDRFEDYMEHDAVIEGCSMDEGALHGLSRADAEDLANRFADVVWDKDNWEERTPRDAFTE